MPAHKEGTNKYLVSKYLEFQMADDKSIMEQVHELQVMVNKLNALSISIPELFQVGAIIAKLPHSWKNFSKRMMHKSEDYSLEDLMKHLCIEEVTHIMDKRGKVKSSVHHVSVGGSSHKCKSGGQNKKNLGPKKQSFKKPSHQNPNSKPKRTGPCYVYGEIGHYARECKITNQDRLHMQPSSVNLGEILMISSLTREICARGWFVDIGATVNICGHRENFRTYRVMPHGTVVICANGHRAEVLGSGDVHVKFTRGEWVTLRDILHVPTISKGLVSTDKFDKGGFKMVLEKGKIVITKGRRYVGRANNCSGMYCLCLSDEGSVCGPSVESGSSSVANVLSVDNDVIGGLVANVNEVNFSVRSKDEAFDAFKRYKVEVENQIERHIKILRSDRGGEYFNQEFDTFCEENGIKHERTSPYTPQQNGLAERKNRTLCEMVNCMLNQLGQPNNLWGEALLTACYVYNRITSRVIPTSPYELWKGRKPNLDYLKMWGCVAYYRTPDPKRIKLGARANKSLFIGYAHNSKAYRLLDTESGVVVESRDVEFFEDSFSRDEEKFNHTKPTKILPPPPIVEEPRRTTRARIEKSFGDNFYSYLVEGTQNKVMREVTFAINLDDDPKTFTEAMTSRDAPLWKEAINDEMDSIMVDLPKGRKPIGSKWIFKRKYHPDGSISAYKARLVAKGYRQREGIDYFDNYAPVARMSSIRILIAISTLKGLYIHQMDVKTTFLNGYLKEDIYLEQPEGFVIPGQENKMKDLGEVDRILGIKVKRTGEKILTKFQYLNIKEFNTPFDSSVKLKVKSGRAVAQLEYASAVGSMMYATHCTRPDIPFDVSKLSQYTVNLGTEHWKAVDRVLGYLKRTTTFELTYFSSNGILEGYFDANWIDHTGDSKSTSG
uniref:Integrase catalytic domain-containing protein n=1 Tax=Lactuca sativa TaxID=4236 RepID=A0A9R1V2Y3_LACSA|nr:hypothetical protein LSAT_V11C700367030 [Lactuca sativa]